MEHYYTYFRTAQSGSRDSNAYELADVYKERRNKAFYVSGDLYDGDGRMADNGMPHESVVLVKSEFCAGLLLSWQFPYNHTDAAVWVCGTRR